MQIRCYCSPSVLDLTTSWDDDDEFDDFNYGEDDDDNDDKKTRVAKVAASWQSAGKDRQNL